ncbi:hypothetical protein THICB1_100518 [Thiomonas arsenitoxydans]|uniref:Uncharacterized protein n=1 Tax=Thiomonas arsenitoxydans (strain DSM 22701 / CIP 110005 / 3As) TaxID=426114 RepID=A0ABP1Z1F6_THIA3|nr:hypothetical protein THICB1_100518 [Thiomonas arsenitoxydans]CQR29680.1 hypothetical protein ACO3_200079 [Thiomonas arsenitoxydans]CQR29690.1 hypothetical protein ACO7_180098 [Thiomonas arsenitoxydans]CQR32851.1 hypothetical protein THICB6_160316 [Thiomonas arsenitoxydans]
MRLSASAGLWTMQKIYKNRGRGALLASCAEAGLFRDPVAPPLMSLTLAAQAGWLNCRILADAFFPRPR